MATTKKTAAPKRSTARRSTRTKTGGTPLERLNESLDAAQKALTDLRGDLSRGARDRLKDVEKLIKDARRDTRKLNKSLRGDLEQLEKALIRGRGRRAPAARKTTSQRSTRSTVSRHATTKKRG